MIIKYSKWKRGLQVEYGIKKKPLGKPTKRIYKEKDRRKYRMSFLTVVCLLTLVMEQAMTRSYERVTSSENMDRTFVIALGAGSSLFLFWRFWQVLSWQLLFFTMRVVIMMQKRKLAN